MLWKSSEQRDQRAELIMWTEYPMLLCLFCHHFIKGKATQSRLLYSNLFYKLYFTWGLILGCNVDYYFVVTNWRTSKKLNFTCAIKMKDETYSDKEWDMTRSVRNNGLNFNVSKNIRSRSFPLILTYPTPLRIGLWTEPGRA